MCYPETPLSLAPESYCGEAPACVLDAREPAILWLPQVSRGNAGNALLGVLNDSLGGF